MKQVASTDQKGHLIVLAGEAIELTIEGHRDTEQLGPLLDHLQAYKDNKPYPTTSTSAPTPPSCCGYPHYDSTNRPNFGPKQVRYLCQLYPGIRVRSRNTKYGVLGNYEVVSRPYIKNDQDKAGWVRQKHDWWIKIRYTDGMCRGIETEISLADSNIVGGAPGTFYEKMGGWNETNWLEFKNQPQHSHRHHCHH